MRRCSLSCRECGSLAAGKTLLWKLLMRERPNIALVLGSSLSQEREGSCITIRDVFNLSAFVRSGSFSLAHAAAAAAVAHSKNQASERMTHIVDLEQTPCSSRGCYIIRREIQHHLFSLERVSFCQMIILALAR